MSASIDTPLKAATAIVGRAFAKPALRPIVCSFFDPITASVTHVLHDPLSRVAMIVDPVLDYDQAAGRTALRSVDAILAYVDEEALNVAWILETHVHADHLSGAAVLRRVLGATVGASRQICDVQVRFAELFDMAGQPETSGFDRLFDDGDAFPLGGVECMALHVPGHTPADMAFVVGDTVLTGDTLFMPDFGTARADFPGGDAGQLFRSVRRLLALPEATRLLHCHDYPPAARGVPTWTSTVAEQRTGNVHVRDGIDEADFIAMRVARDATLSTPTLMMPSVQVNMRGGELPSPAANGRRYLKVPIDAL